jgi:ParB/RepB/Spo0J family partition protein
MSMTTKKAVEEIAYDLVDPDPNQPRKIFNEQKLTELANDIGVNGILQAIVVRPHPTKKGRYMIIFGERRFRAAGMVDLETVPCVVRTDVNDAQALEWQMAENGQRDDMHPLEEADGYRVMHERDGRDVEEIAELCGKSKAYIYAAMKLCALAAEPRKAFLAGKFDKSVALLIARLPVAHQNAACQATLTKGPTWQSNDGSAVMSYRQARDYLQRTYMLRLADAPFKVNDETLVSKAGACTTCPKRSGNQRELFADVVNDRDDGGADVCTDSTCYQAKVDVHWSRLADAAKQKGRTVLEGKQAQGAGGYSDKKYVDLDAPANDLGEYNKSYRQLLGKQADEAVAAIARDDRGDIKELVPRAELKQRLKEAGVKVKKEMSSSSAASTKEDREERKQEEAVEAETHRRVYAAVEAKLAGPETVGMWRLFARMAARKLYQPHDLLKRHNAVPPDSELGDGGALIRLIEKKQSTHELRALTFEILCAGRDHLDMEELKAEGDLDDYDYQAEDQSSLEDAVLLFKIDIDAITAESKQFLAAAAKAKEAEKAAKKKQPKAGAAANGVTPAAEATSS